MTCRCLQMIMRLSIRWLSNKTQRLSVVCVSAFDCRLLVIGAFLVLLTSCRLGPPPKQSRFNEKRSFGFLKQLCDIGPRNNGSETKKRAEAWLEQTLRDSGAEVTTHEFTYTPDGSSAIASFKNIVARFKPNEPRRVMLATHYDTRSVADRDPNETRRNQPIIGANDGGSGVAVLLELATLWKEQPPPVGVDLIFFDGEDFGSRQDLADYFLGSKAYVREHPEYKPEWGVVIDMVGDSDLTITRERSSLAVAPTIVERVWQAAMRVGADAFRGETGGRVIDDHSVFLEKGIPVILVIDFHYESFHTVDDTLDKCSPASLGQVGRTLLEVVEASP